MKKNFLVFGKPLIEQGMIDEVVKTLRSGWIGTGPKVTRFENLFKSYKKVKHVVAVNSCTAALHLSMLALEIKEKDEVITSPMTFCATLNAIIHTGARPVLVDCNKQTMNIDTELIEEKITRRTKAIVPVHFAGRPCEMDRIVEIARRYNLKVIEDCAHAIEAEYQGRKTGTFGEVGCFSFYVTKNITTAEGGMVITDSDRIAAKVKMYALHGLSKHAWQRYSDKGFKHYQVFYPGFKYNMTDIQASLGIPQFKKINALLAKRQLVWQRYSETFKDLPLIVPLPPAPNTVHSYHLYPILLRLEKLKISRDSFLDLMTKAKIGTGVHYIAAHLHPYYQQAYGYKPGDFPNAEFISQRTVSLPLSANLSAKDVDNVIFTVRRILTKNYKR